MPSSKDLQPPPKARIKYSKDDTGVTTGFEWPAKKSLKNSKNRRRERPSHDIPSKSQESPEETIFTYFEKEAETKDSASCVFLLWGPGNSETSKTWAVDVPTTELESEDLIFTALAKRYADELGFWRGWLSLRKFSKLKPVTFRLICRSSGRFLVFIEPLNLDKCKKTCSDMKDKAFKNAESVVIYESDGFVEICQRDSKGEYKDHIENCPMKWNDGEYCPFMSLDSCRDQIRWIETASFLSCYLHNPDGARYQNILEGFGEHCFHYQYRDVGLLKGELESQNRYLQLNGLYIETAWNPIKCLYVFLGLLFCVLVVGKLCWGSWEITFGAGSFFVALPMLVLTVRSYYEDEN